MEERKEHYHEAIARHKIGHPDIAGMREEIMDETAKKAHDFIKGSAKKFKHGY